MDKMRSEPSLNLIQPVGALLATYKKDMYPEKKICTSVRENEAKITINEMLFNVHTHKHTHTQFIYI